jgi:hypothetical protein
MPPNESEPDWQFPQKIDRIYRIRKTRRIEDFKSLKSS